MNGGRVLLHICCAPDATVPWPALAAERSEVVGCFYGANIHPTDERERRRDAVIKLAGVLSKDVVMCDDCADDWFRAVAGLEDRAEGGKRCAVCFDAQLRAAAREAVRLGCAYLCTTLTISPHKDVDLINSIGRSAASAFGIEWIDRVWRKGGGFVKSVALSKEIGLYRQNYCGCVFSAAERKEVRHGRTE